MKKLFFSMLAVAAMASCSKSELVERPAADQGVAIMAKSTALAIESNTRSPFEGSTIDNDHKLIAKVWASTTKDVYSGSVVSGSNVPTYNGGFNNTDKMIFTSVNQVGFDTDAMYFPADKDIVYLFGLYPYDLDWTEVVASSKSSAATTIDGKSDIMVAPQVEASKAKHQLAVPEYPTLAFEHMLTKLIVKVVAESEAAINAWGDVTDITLTNANGGIKDEISIACVDATPGSKMTGKFQSSGTVNYYSFFKMTGATDYTDVKFAGLTSKADGAAAADTDAVVLTETAAEAAYLLVAPLANAGASKEDFTLEVKTTKYTTPYEVKINLEDATGTDYNQSTQAKYFVLTLTFKATEIQAKATVVEWENGGNGGADIK